MFRFDRAMLLSMTIALLLTGAALPARVQAQNPAPDRGDDEGLGPFDTLVIRGVTVIDGTGGPPRGPVNVVVKGNRIASVGGRGSREADHVIDARGMYLMPGFVDMHAHCGGSRKAPDAEYIYKLWMAHGVTTVRGVPLASHDWTEKEKARSAANEIVAPRIFNYQRPGNVSTPEEAREWVRQAAANGVDGLKLGAYPPAVMAALLEEARRHGLGTTAHLAQTGVAQMDAMDAARLGLDTVTHYYGHFEALLKDYTVQPWPLDHNYNNEQDRFGQVARLWDKIHPPGSPEWKAYLKEHLELGTVFDPTMTIYSAGRDVMRARTVEWHDKYTLPSLWDFFQPSRNHGSYWYDWTTSDEVAWKNFYRVWMQLLNDYKKMGGRVTTGSDSGFIYDTYGFAYIEELELLQEAGFHPLEVMQAATMNGALTLHEPKGKPIEFGIIRTGLLADMVIVDQNPLHNFKVLFGTGAIKLNEETGDVERVGGVKWTIKDGIVYDAKQLLADAAEMVDKQKAARRSQSELLEEPVSAPATTAADQATAEAVEADEPTMIQSGQIVMVVSSEQNRIWAYSETTGRWTSKNVPNEAGVRLQPVLGDTVAALQLGQQVFAYSAETGRWDELEVPVSNGTELQITVDTDLVLVRTPAQVSAFGAKPGVWRTVDIE